MAIQIRDVIRLTLAGAATSLGRINSSSSGVMDDAVLQQIMQIIEHEVTLVVPSRLLRIHFRLPWKLADI